MHGAGFNRTSQGLRVRPNQTTGPQLDATEIPTDDRQTVTYFKPLQHRRHGLAGRSAGLTVVATVLIKAITDAIRPAVMASFGVLLTDLRECRLVIALAGQQIDNKAALFHFVFGVKGRRRSSIACQ